MTDSGQPHNARFEAEDELDYLFANASPNPNRVGCPTHEDLVRVSRMEAPIGDAIYTHIVGCSPCFREMRAERQARARARKARVLAVAAAAVVALIVGASWWMVQPPSATVVATTIDLRPFAVMRGDAQPPPPSPVVIPRGRLDATILLPLGSEPGTYEVQLRDESLSIPALATGEASLRDSVTTLRVTLDTTALPAGTYQLEVRRVGSGWRSFPVRLR